MRHISRIFFTNLNDINGFIGQIDYIAKKEDVYTEHHLALDKEWIILVTTFDNGRNFKHRQYNTETL